MTDTNPYLQLLDAQLDKAMEDYEDIERVSMEHEWALDYMERKVEMIYNDDEQIPLRIKNIINHESEIIRILNDKQKVITKEIVNLKRQYDTMKRLDSTIFKDLPDDLKRYVTENYGGKSSARKKTHKKTHQKSRRNNKSNKQ